MEQEGRINSTGCKWNNISSTVTCKKPKFGNKNEKYIY